MTTRPRALRRRTVTAVALAALTSGLAAAPAATAVPRAVTTHNSSPNSTGTRDPAAVRTLLATLPDGVTDAALVRVAGRGMRTSFTGTAGPVATDARFPRPRRPG